MATAYIRSAVERVRRELETRLLQGVWAAGTRLPAERALAEEMNVSRATVREAISRLAARDMLVSRPGSGVFVTDRLQAGFASPWRQLVAEVRKVFKVHREVLVHKERKVHREVLVHKERKVILELEHKDHRVTMALRVKVLLTRVRTQILAHMHHMML